MASSISAGTTSATALVHTADTSGALELKTNNGTTALTLSTAQNATFAGTLTTAAQGIAKASLPAGAVLQVVSTTKTDTFSTTSTSFVDITGLSVTITPTSSSSKIFIVVNAIGGSGGASNALCTFRLMRDSTAINIGNAASGYTQASVGGMRVPFDTNASWLVPMSFLDAPATTSATTYKIQGSIESNTLRINTLGSDVSGNQFSYRGASTITVMEIAA